MIKSTGLFLLLVTFLGGTLGATVQVNSDPLRSVSAEDIEYRLPREVKPLRYDLYFQPDLKNGNFKGQESILINLSGERKYLILNQQDLNIDSVNLYKYGENNDQTEIKIREYYPIPEKQAFIIYPEEQLSIGQYDLKLSYSGSLKGKTDGFYMSSYKDEFNKPKPFLLTRFEPAYARKAFPSFDEPSFKAEFNLKLVYPSENYSALSNMNCEKLLPNDPAPGFTTAQFAKSPLMSTYQLNFIISDLVWQTKNAKGLDNRDIPISIYTTKAQKDKGQFALDAGVKYLEYFSKFFNIDYPMPKLEMVAISDYQSGPLPQNWGLMFFRDNLIIYDNYTTNTRKQSMLETMASSYANMWFGNLASQAWYDNDWFYNSFIKYLTAKSASDIFPEWYSMDQFILKTLQPALEADSKSNYRQLVQKIDTPDEIYNKFDDITYAKGASIFRMFANSFGPEKFFKGVSKFLQKYSYGNAGPEEFYETLQAEFGKKVNVKDFMNTWTMQMGYPVVYAKRINSTQYFLTQKRFLANSEAKYKRNDSPYFYKYQIPLTYITNKNSEQYKLLDFDEITENLTIKFDEPIEWIKFNYEQTGYYRVNYDKYEWDAYQQILKSDFEKILKREDRAQLLDDAFSLAYAGELDYAVPLDMARYLMKEKYYLPWSVAINKFEDLQTLIMSARTGERMRGYLRELVDPIYRSVSWEVKESDNQETRNFRNAILEFACSMGHKECLKDLETRFRAWIGDEKDIRPQPDIRKLVYSYGMKYFGGESEWNTMLERFKKEENSKERIMLMKGLGNIQSTPILQKYISFAMDENYVQPQDIYYALTTISKNPMGKGLIWDWVRENYMAKRSKLDYRSFGSLIPVVTKSFSTQDKLDEMKKFFDKYPQSSDIYRAQALENVELNIRWLERNLDKIDSWLDLNPKPTQ